MLGKLLMILLPVLALLGGAAGGAYLRPAPPPTEPAATDAAAEGGHVAGEAANGTPAGHGDSGHGAGNTGAAGHDTGSQTGKDGEASELTWFKFPQQFFIPLVRDGTLSATMVLSLTLEMPASAAEEVFAKEFRLRDALLRQMLIHANTGGFDGNFTADAHIQSLRQELLTAVQTVDPRIDAVLIGDIARQQ